MAFGKFIRNEYRVTLEALENSGAHEADLRNDVVEQLKRDADEKIGKKLKDSLSEDESCKGSSIREEDNVKDEENNKNNVKKSEDVDAKLLKDNEKFAYKLRRLRAQLFEKNENGEMSRPSIEKYEKMVKKFMSKFKNYKMPKNVMLLKYEVDLWNKKVVDTKQALASVVNESKGGSAATTRASELSEEVDAVVTGINSDASVSLAISPLGQ